MKNEKKNRQERTDIETRSKKEKKQRQRQDERDFLEQSLEDVEVKGINLKRLIQR